MNAWRHEKDEKEEKDEKARDDSNEKDEKEGLRCALQHGARPGPAAWVSCGRASCGAAAIAQRPLPVSRRPLPTLPPRRPLSLQVANCRRLRKLRSGQCNARRNDGARMPNARALPLPALLSRSAVRGQDPPGLNGQDFGSLLDVFGDQQAQGELLGALLKSLGGPVDSATFGTNAAVNLTWLHAHALVTLCSDSRFLAAVDSRPSPNRRLALLRALWALGGGIATGLPAPKQWPVTTVQAVGKALEDCVAQFDKRMKNIDKGVARAVSSCAWGRHDAWIKQKVELPAGPPWACSFRPDSTDPTSMGPLAL